MNTILTDDERPKLPGRRLDAKRHEEQYTVVEMEAYADAREAAVLAKLREQEPQDIDHVGQGLVDVWKSRAAPLPAVVQVPKCKCGQPWILNTVHREHSPCWRAADPVDGLAAAPEAPAGSERTGCAAGTDAECRHRACATKCPALKSAPEAPAPAVQNNPKAIAFDWLLSNCLTEDKNGWLRVVFETSRQREHHHPDCAKWVAQDIAEMAGVDLEAAPEAPAQGDLIENLCARIKAADDAAAGWDYMLDSNDCISVIRGTWKGPLQNDCPEKPAQAIPAPWREAVKVMREAVATIQASIVEEGISAGRREYRSELFTRMAAALAQLDALEGGE